LDVTVTSKLSAFYCEVSQHRVPDTFRPI